MRPSMQLLARDQVVNIVTAAYDILESIGILLESEEAAALLIEHGARAVRNRLRMKPDLINRALETVPSKFFLYDTGGICTHSFDHRQTYFTPGSSALYILDEESGEIRRPDSADYIRYVMLTEQLGHIQAQSTAFVPADVPEPVTDSYRLFLSLLYGRKPVVTGVFTSESFKLMKRFQEVVRGDAVRLKEKPLTVFSCCPTSPLKWSRLTADNLIGCALGGIPVEIIAMPLAGYVAPVSLTGTLIQHTAETLSGLVIHQLAAPGGPLLYGGSPAIFDMRHTTTPMGAIETMMIDCAYQQIAEFFHVPSQAYMALSDAPALDAQCGMESGIGAVMASLARFDQISGPGMLYFENVFSLEKLVFDHEICSVSRRLQQGIHDIPEGSYQDLFQQLIENENLLGAEDTAIHHRREHIVPGPVINRLGSVHLKTENLIRRVRTEIDGLLKQYHPPSDNEHISVELINLMSAEAARYGMTGLPDRPVLT